MRMVWSRVNAVREREIVTPNLVNCVANSQEKTVLVCPPLNGSNLPMTFLTCLASLALLATTTKATVTSSRNAER